MRRLVSPLPAAFAIVFLMEASLFVVAALFAARLGRAEPRTVPADRTLALPAGSA
jgi:hypothetical protein